MQVTRLFIQGSRVTVICIRAQHLHWQDFNRLNLYRVFTDDTVHLSYNLPQFGTRVSLTFYIVVAPYTLTFVKTYLLKFTL